jgi:small-conductance mechanosensitive channel
MRSARARIRVGISIDSDVTRAREILTEIARAHPAALQDPQPWVVFDKFGDSTFELELVVWSVEMSYRPRAFRSDLNFEIERRFRRLASTCPGLDGHPRQRASASARQRATGGC